MKTETPHNPLDRYNLGLSVTQALLKRDPVPLGTLEKFQGAGVYAIYYTGCFPAYRKIMEANRNGAFAIPIYVGMATPEGGRKGVTVDSSVQCTKLFKRLKEHAGSLSAAANLDLADFWCRYLTVEDIWIPLGESVLINQFSPLWNVKLDGFGNHAQGGGRSKQKRAPWDTVHPGRRWAKDLPDGPKTAKELLEEVKIFLSK